MKKLLLSASALMLALGASAQLTGTDYFTLDLLNASSQCLINAGLPNNGGIMNGDGATISASSLTTNGLELTGAATINPGTQPTWFSLPVIVGSGASASCSTLNGENSGVDMTSKSMLQVTFSSSLAGATLEMFVGGDGQWSPASSTFNTGSGDFVIVSKAATAAGTEYTASFNLADSAVFAAWAGRNKVQSVGFRAATANAVFTVTKVEIGNVPSSSSSIATSNVSVYPNPASAVVNVNVGSASNAIVQLTDVTGKVVASVSGVSGTTVINTNVPAGLYVVSVTSASGVVTSKVIVK